MPCLGDNILLLLLQIASDKETFVVVGSSANIRPDWILLQAGRSQVLPKQIISERANYVASRIKCVFRERNGMTGNMGNLWEAVCNWQPPRSIASSIAIEAAYPFQPKIFSSSYKTISFHSELKRSIIGVGPCFSWDFDNSVLLWCICKRLDATPGECLYHMMESGHRASDTLIGSHLI